MSQGERKGGEDVGGLGQINSHFDPPSLRSSLIDDERKGRGGGFSNKSSQTKPGCEEWSVGNRHAEVGIPYSAHSLLVLLL